MFPVRTDLLHKPINDPPAAEKCSPSGSRAGEVNDGDNGLVSAITVS